VLQWVYIELWRFLKALSRYPMELLGGFLSVLMVFALFFYGARYLAGPAFFGDRLETLVVSLLAWTLALSLLSHIASTLAEEALSGILEQLALTRPGLLGVVLTRSALSLLQMGLLNIPLFLAVTLISGARLDFDWLILLPLLTLALGALGLGLLLGGLALIYKRLGQLISILQFPLLGLFLIRFEALARPWGDLGYLLPLTPSVGALRLILGREQVPEWSLLVLSGVNALAYLVLGLVFFRRALRSARRQGTLGTH